MFSTWTCEGKLATFTQHDSSECTTKVKVTKYTGEWQLINYPATGMTAEENMCEKAKCVEVPEEELLQWNVYKDSACTDLESKLKAPVKSKSHADMAKGHGCESCSAADFGRYVDVVSFPGRGCPLEVTSTSKSSDSDVNSARNSSHALAWLLMAMMVRLTSS